MSEKRRVKYTGGFGDLSFEVFEGDKSVGHGTVSGSSFRDSAKLEAEIGGLEFAGPLVGAGVDKSSMATAAKDFFDAQGMDMEWQDGG